MRKKVFGRHLSRGRKAREALLRSLVKALIVNGKITTTKAKAKATVPLAEGLISDAKKNDISAQRRVASKLGNDRRVTKILFTQVAPALSGKTSGFTRITLLAPRKGDSAEMVILSWSEEIIHPEDKKAKKEEKTAKVKKTGKTNKK